MINEKFIQIFTYYLININNNNDNNHNFYENNVNDSNANNMNSIAKEWIGYRQFQNKHFQNDLNTQSVRGR